MLQLNSTFQTEFIFKQQQQQISAAADQILYFFFFIIYQLKLICHQFFLSSCSIRRTQPFSFLLWLMNQFTKVNQSVRSLELQQNFQDFLILCVYSWFYANSNNSHTICFCNFRSRSRSSCLGKYFVLLNGVVVVFQLLLLLLVLLLPSFQVVRKTRFSTFFYIHMQGIGLVQSYRIQYRIDCRRRRVLNQNRSSKRKHKKKLQLVWFALLQLVT